MSIATPDFAHVEPVMTKLEAGKQVVVEKPLATITAEAEAMVRAAREKGLKRTHNRGNPDYSNIRDSVQSGQIGNPKMACGWSP